MTAVPFRRIGISARWIVGAAIVLAYVATGFYTVPANEIAVVRRFGRAIQPFRTSGLHFDWPWPMVRVDRVNLNAIRTLTVGEAADEANGFLTPVTNQPTTFLTGDKNLLQLRITVQYRVAEEFLAEWLYASSSLERRLQQLVETTAADLVSRSGVDFVHTQGLSELNNRLLTAVRSEASKQRLGCDVEQVTIDRAEPPTRVKAEFLDVSNARADMARSVHEARSYAEQKQAESRADAKQLIDAARRERGARIANAKGSADRFSKLVDQMRRDAESSGRDYQTARTLTMNRMYIETIRDVLSQSKSKLVVDGQPADLLLPTGRTSQ